MQPPFRHSSAHALRSSFYYFCFGFFYPSKKKRSREKRKQRIAFLTLMRFLNSVKVGRYNSDWTVQAHSLHISPPHCLLVHVSSLVSVWYLCSKHATEILACVPSKSFDDSLCVCVCVEFFCCRDLVIFPILKNTTYRFYFMGWQSWVCILLIELLIMWLKLKSPYFPSV